MAGWELKEGKLDTTEMDQDEFWKILKAVFSNKSKKTTSYKYCFFKSIIDNIFNYYLDYRISFEQLFDTASEIYWNLVHRHGLRQHIPNNQGKLSRIEIIIDKIVTEYTIPDETLYEYLDEHIQIELKKNVNKELKKYVVGAFYDDTDGRFYEFSKDNMEIKIHPNIYDYLTKYKYLVEKLNYYEWLKFLEKVNPLENSFGLATKLDESNKRSSLMKYRQYLEEIYHQEECFYCSKKLVKDKVHVDHFIPWSYIKTDQLWNFVLSCEECNSKKSDKLPQNIYVENLIIRNDIILKEYGDNFVNEEFSNYSEEKFKTVFQAAISNGHESDWKVKCG